MCKTQSLHAFIYSRKYTNDCMMFLVVLLFQTAAIIPKTSSFLDFHLQPLATEVKSYIKNTNDFLRKPRSLPNLPDDIILCTVDVVGLYPNIPHDEGLPALRKRLDLRQEKMSPPQH